MITTAGIIAANNRKRANAGGGGPSLWISQGGAHEDYWGQTSASSNYSQRINADGREISSVKLYIYRPSSDAAVHLEFWDHYDTASGTQIGGDSSSVTIDSGSTANQVEFTWSSNLPQITGKNIWMHVISEDINQVRISVTDDPAGTSYLDTTYAVYSPSGVVGAGSDDMRFEIYATEITTAIAPTSTYLDNWWTFDNTPNDAHGSLNLTAIGSVTYDNVNEKAGTHCGNVPSGNSYWRNTSFPTDAHTSDFSVTTWVQIADNTVDQEIMGQWDSATTSKNWVLRYDAGNNLQVAIGDSSGSNAIASSATFDAENTWVHLALVRSGDDLEIWVDGVNDATADLSGITENTATLTLFIGRNGIALMEGKLDEVNVWDKALAPEEILWLYNSGNGRAYADL